MSVTNASSGHSVPLQSRSMDVSNELKRSQLFVDLVDSDDDGFAGAAPPMKRSEPVMASPYLQNEDFDHSDDDDVIVEEIRQLRPETHSVTAPSPSINQDSAASGSDFGSKTSGDLLNPGETTPAPEYRPQLGRFALSLQEKFGGPATGIAAPWDIQRIMRDRGVSRIVARGAALFDRFYRYLREKAPSLAQSALQTHRFLDQQQREIRDKRAELIRTRGTPEFSESILAAYEQLLQVVNDYRERLCLGTDVAQTDSFLHAARATVEAHRKNIDSQFVHLSDVRNYRRAQQHEAAQAGSEIRRVAGSVSSAPYIPGVPNGRLDYLDRRSNVRTRGSGPDFDPDYVEDAENAIDDSIDNLALTAAQALHGESQATSEYQSRGFLDSYAASNDVDMPEADLADLLDHAQNEAVAMNMPPEMNVTSHEHQRQGLGWLLRAEKSKYRGSMLCDDMGLGKTVQAIALMYTNPPKPPSERSDDDCHLTLIICPVAMISTWRNELSDRVHSGHHYRVYVHHRGLNGGMFLTHASQIKQYDVVLASYDGVANEWNNFQARRRPYPLFQIKFHRIILDESHMIRNFKTKRSEAVAELDAEYRLCLSGTPMQNRVDDLFAQVRFLKVPNWGHSIGVFRNLSRRRTVLDEQLDTIERIGSDRPCGAFQALLGAIQLRRKKNSVINGRKILEDLPNKVEKDKYVFLTEEQQNEYSAIQSMVQSDAQSMMTEATTTGQQIMGMLVLLLRLRQAADHPRLAEVTRVLRSQKTKKSTEKQLRDIASAAVRNLSDSQRIEILQRGRIQSEMGELVFGDDSLILCDNCRNECGLPCNALILFPCNHVLCDNCAPDLAQADGDADDDKPTCTVCSTEVREHSTVEAILVVQRSPGLSTYHYGQLLLEAADARAAQLKQQRLDEDRDMASNASHIGLPHNENFYAIDDSADEYDLSHFGIKVQVTDSNQETRAVTNPALHDSEPILEIKPEAEFRSTQDFDLKVDLQTQNPVSGPDGSGVIERAPAQSIEATSASTHDPLEFRIPIDRILRESPVAKVFPDGWVSSAKIDQTLNILREVWRENPERKVILFSSFTSMLALLEIPLQAASIGYDKYQGDVSAPLRSEILHRFKTDPHCRVLLVSIMAGSVGLTLTEASCVIILDPYWNPYVEDQAKDRVYRIGQRHDVLVNRLLICNTVEDRIVDLQNRKRDIIEAAQDSAHQRRPNANLNRDELMYALGLTNNFNRLQN